MARTDTLGNFLTDVADAIREKKGTSETIQASDFDTEIENIPSGGGDLSEYFVTEITENTTSTNKYASGLINKMPNIIVNNSVTSLSYAFANYYIMEGATQVYSSLAFPLPKIIFGNNITDISYMYRYANVNTIDLTNCDTSNVTTCRDMFANSNVIEINMIGCASPSLTTTRNMFSGCVYLQKIDIRDMTFDNVSNSQNMFNSVPTNCEIIVKSQTEKSWVLNVRNDLTNVKTVAEYEAE